MRGKPDYITFLRRFVKQVVGAHEWNSRLMDPKLDPDKLFTPSDEAFALLVLENNYIRWLDIFEQNNHKMPLPARQEPDQQVKKKFLSNVPPEFTSGGNKFHSPPKNRTKGWSKDGIDRFNQHYQQVLRDRRDYPSFNEEFITNERKGQEQEKTKVKPAPKRIMPPMAMQDEFSDDEDDNDDIENEANHDADSDNHYGDIVGV